MIAWSPTPVLLLPASSNIWYGSRNSHYGSRSCKVSHLVMLVLGLSYPSYLGQLTLLTTSEPATATAGIMRGIFTIIEPHNNISVTRENQFLTKVTALSAVSQQGELQFWLLCISTSITIFLWGWAGWRTELSTEYWVLSTEYWWYLQLDLELKLRQQLLDVAGNWVWSVLFVSIVLWQSDLVHLLQDLELVCSRNWVSYYLVITSDQN